MLAYCSHSRPDRVTAHLPGTFVNARAERVIVSPVNERSRERAKSIKGENGKEGGKKGARGAGTTDAYDLTPGRNEDTIITC